MARVIPFPLARRSGWVRRQAAWFCDQSHAAAEKNLRAALEVQRQTMERRGVSADLIEGELEAGQSAIRAEIWRLVLTPEASA